MINDVHGDLLVAKERHIVHGCNAIGVMGSGVALQIRLQRPQVYLGYVKFIRETENPLGRANIVEDGDKIFGNLITQATYGRNPRVRYADPKAIETSLSEFIELTGADEIAMPRIGCGLGNLSWRNDVKPILEKFNISFQIYSL